MAYGIEVLRKAQIGIEATAGTDEAADVIWRGPVLIKDQRVIRMVNENVGQFARPNRSYIPWKESTVEFGEVEATFEHLPYLFECGVEYVQTATAEGSGWIREYNVPTATTANTIKTLTVEAGDNARVDQALHTFMQEIKLTWATKEALMMAATAKCAQVADAEFTNVAAVETVEEVLGNPQIWIDATTIGTTTITGSLLGGTVTITTGWQFVPVSDGQVYPGSRKFIGATITGSLIFEHDGNAETEITAARAETLRYVRVQFSGSSLTTAGTTYSTKAVRLDLALRYTSVPDVAARDGDNIVTLPFEARGTTNYCNVVIVNNVNTLT